MIDVYKQGQPTELPRGLDTGGHWNDRNVVSFTAKGKGVVTFTG